MSTASFTLVEAGADERRQEVHQRSADAEEESVRRQPAARAPMRAASAIPVFVGSLAGAIAIVLIWAARSSVDRTVYVSEMGSSGEPTEAVFRVALGSIAVAGLLIGGFGRRRLCGAAGAGIAALVAIGGGCFAVAAVVPCTTGCPPPGQPGFTVQDLVHLSAAILGFALACLAMLLAARTSSRRFGTFSLATAAAMAVIAGAGGLLSLTRTATGFGAWCEFVAASLGILWLIALGLRGSIPTLLRRPGPAF